MSALENQANQLGLQAAQECERLAKDRTLTLQMLQKVRTNHVTHRNNPKVLFWLLMAWFDCPGEGEAVGP